MGISNSGVTLPDGSIKTWGNSYLGDGTSDSNVPVDVLINAISLVLGKGHNSCVLLPGHDAIKCWGDERFRTARGRDRRTASSACVGALKRVRPHPLDVDLGSGSTCQPTCEGVRGVRVELVPHLRLSDGGDVLYAPCWPTAASVTARTR